MNAGPTHPYRNRAAFTRWSNAVAAIPTGEMDPAVDFPFQLSGTERIATAGSCFAQHISRHLTSSNLNYFVTEPGHPLLTSEIKEKHNYGVYSARYGNIYTARQLLQLFRRAFGSFEPEDDVWTLDDGTLVDALRPTIQPRGFSNLGELNFDRKRHLTAVRELFEKLDCLFLTLGLTEEWASAVDGTVYPVCPGVHGGRFDERVHKFVNYRVADVVSDLTDFYHCLKAINSSARIIITVSPVPLIATAENKHVLLANTYSKAVLRAAAAEFVESFQKDCAYFPSFEIVTGAHTRGSYFASDLRSVTEEGVTHVMRVFFRTVYGSELLDRKEHVAALETDNFAEAGLAAMKVVCDEELLRETIP